MDLLFKVLITGDESFRIEFVPPSKFEPAFFDKVTQTAISLANFSLQVASQLTRKNLHGDAEISVSETEEGYALEMKGKELRHPCAAAAGIYSLENWYMTLSSTVEKVKHRIEADASMNPSDIDMYVPLIRKTAREIRNGLQKSDE